MIDACLRDGHAFELIDGRKYFKRRDGVPDTAVLGPYNQNVSYVMLFCTKCGETKEVIANEH